MGSSAWLLAPREAKGQGQKRKASLVRRAERLSAADMSHEAEEQYLWPWPWWVEEGPHTLSPPSTLSGSARRWAQALPMMTGPVSVRGSQHCLRGSGRTAGGAGMPREGRWESSAA